MKNLRALVVVFVAILITQSVKAQDKSLKLDVNYNYSIPLSGFKNDLVSESSPRGFMAGLMYSFNEKISGGLSFGFQDYYEKFPRALYSLGKTQEVSAVITNSIQLTPILLKAKYFLASKPGATIQPYLSLGAGANMIDFKQYFGQFGNSQTSVGFRAQGGAGLMIPFKKSGSSGINIGATYDYAPYKKNGYKDLSSVNFQAGVVIELR